MRAESDVKTAESALQEREKTAKAQDSRIMQERATLENARYDLGKVRIESTIDGIVTRRNIQEGETAVIGTMNNAGTVLLELADMSVIQAEVEVDETNIPNVQLGQPAKISIDAIPERTFKGHVSEIGNSPIQAAAGRAPAPRRRTSRWWSSSTSRCPTCGPGFTCTADITTATRQHVTAVPIPAVAVRELIYDAEGLIVKEPRPDKRRRRRRADDGLDRAQAGADAQGDRGRLHRPRRQRGVRPDQAGDRRRQVLRGAVGPQGARSR